MRGDLPSTITPRRISRRHVTRLVAIGVAGVAAAPLLAACGGGAGAGPSQGGGSAGAGSGQGGAGGAPAEVTVRMNDQNQYVPAAITVARGTTVTWTNVGVMPHTVTTDPSKASNKANAVVPAGVQPWDSGVINGGQSWSHTFTVSGDYTYFCLPHEQLGMIGTITVTG